MKKILFIIVFIIISFVFVCTTRAEWGTVSKMIWCPVFTLTDGTPINPSYRLYSAQRSMGYAPDSAVLTTTNRRVLLSDLVSLPVGTNYFVITVVWEEETINYGAVESNFSREVWAIKYADGHWEGYRDPTTLCPPEVKSK